MRVPSPAQKISQAKTRLSQLPESFSLLSLSARQALTHTPLPLRVIMPFRFSAHLLLKTSGHSSCVQSILTGVRLDAGVRAWLWEAMVSMPSTCTQAHILTAASDSHCPGNLQTQQSVTHLRVHGTQQRQSHGKAHYICF